MKSEIEYCQSCFEPFSTIEDAQSRDKFSKFLSEVANQMLISDPRLRRVRQLQQQISLSRHNHERKSNKLSHKAAVISIAGCFLFELSLLAVSNQASGGISFPGFWILAASCSLIFSLVFLKFWVMCPGCKKFSYRKLSLLQEEVIGESQGWHTESKEIVAYTSHRDSRGRQSGHSESSVYVPTRVAHIDVSSNRIYCCAHCNLKWERIVTRRTNVES